MSESSVTVLPFDIIEKIVDALAIEDPKGLQYVKAFSLTCQSFLPICRKHIFSSLEIRVGNYRVFRRVVRFRKIDNGEAFAQLLLETPTIAKYVRQLTMHIIPRQSGSGSSFDQVAQQLTRLQSLTVSLWDHHQNSTDWNNLPSSMQDSLLSLMHLPTLSHLGLETIKNFPIFNLFTCTNLKHLSTRDLHISSAHAEAASSLLHKSIQLQGLDLLIRGAQTRELLEAKCPDGRPILDLTSLEKIYIRGFHYDWAGVAREIFKNTQKLTDIYLDVHTIKFRDMELAKLVTPSLQTLRRVRLKFTIDSVSGDPLLGLCEELEDISGKNRLESIRMHIVVNGSCRTGAEWGRLEKVLLKPGWPILKHISLVIVISTSVGRIDGPFGIALQGLPYTQFTGLISSKNLDFQFLVREE